MLSYAAIHGFGKLTLRIKLYLAYVMMRYKVSYDELVGYWNTYVGTWGGKAKTFRIKGYKDDVMVKKIEVGPSTTFDLEVSSSKNRLVNEETYDTARIRIRYVDEHRRLMQYAAKIIDIKTSGPIELIGTNKQSLHGGQLSLFVKSKLQKGEGKIIISVEGITKEIIIPVL